MPIARHMLHRLITITSMWMLWTTFRTSVAVFFSIQGLSVILILVAMLALAVRHKARPLTKRASFLAHLRPMTEEQKSECIKDLEKIGNDDGLDKLWNAARQGKDTTILLTGVTGYVGRAILHQLLRRVAAHLGKGNTKIILIARPDKEGSAVDRIQRLQQEDIFSQVPKSLWDSVIQVTETASLSHPNLGCSMTTLQELKEASITHIVHCAADVRFTRDLRDLAASNITAALQLQGLARECPSCERMVFVSTAFVNPANGSQSVPKPEVLVDLTGYDPEELYHSMIGDQGLARQVMKELGFQNNYVFSKCVAEHLLSRDTSNKTYIARPSIVGPAWCLPQPGWNGNSPSTITAFGVMCMSRLIRVSRTCNAPIAAIPVDVVAVGVVNAMVHSQAQESSQLSGACSIKNLAWDARSKIKYCRNHEYLSSGFAFAVLAGHFSTTEAALVYALQELVGAYPGWADALHEVFNRGPLKLMNLLQVALQRVGISLLPGFPAGKLLKFVDIVALYGPFMGYAHHFSSELHIPESFDVDRHNADQFKTMHRFTCELSSKKKPKESSNRRSALQELYLVPKGRSDLWWAMTQPNGNFAVRVLCFFASKVIRAVYGDVVMDVETTAAALECLSGTDDSAGLVLVPTYRSLMDLILVIYITFAFPYLGIDIPSIVADKPFDDGILSILSRWVHMTWLDPSQPTRDSVQSAASNGRPIALFLEGTPSHDRRPGKPSSAMLRALQTSQVRYRHILLPMCLDYDRVLEHDRAVAQLGQDSAPALTWFGLLAFVRDVVKGAKKRELGNVRVSLGQPYELDSTSDVDEACGFVLEEQLSLSNVTTFHLEVAQSHLGIPSEVLHRALAHVGGVVVLHNKKQQYQINSNVEKWCLHMQWIHRFASFVEETHPRWASWLRGDEDYVKTIAPVEEVTSDVQRVLEILRDVFDSADLLAAQTMASLAEKGITAMSTSHLVREMAAHKSSRGELLGYPVTTAAASFAIEKRTEATIAATAKGPIAPVYASAPKELSSHRNRSQKVLGSLFKVDLSASFVDSACPSTAAAPCPSTAQTALMRSFMATSLKSNQVCVGDETLQLGGTQYPDCVVYPASESQCIEITNIAKENCVRLITYNGSDRDVGELRTLNPEEDARPFVLVNLRQMNKVAWLDKDAGLVCVEAGMTGKDLRDQLSKHGLSVHAQLATSSRVGDYVAKWTTELDQSAVNNIKGVRLVTSNGVMGTAESARGCGAKNFAIGSEGKVGIITNAIIRVRPQRDLVKQAETYAFPDFKSGIDFLREVAKLSLGLGPSLASLMDNAQCNLSTMMGDIHEKKNDQVDVRRTLNDAYVFQWKGIDRQQMSLCSLVFEGKEEELSARRQLVEPIAKRCNGVRTFSKEVFPIAGCGLPKQSVLSASIETWAPWSRCADMCQQVKHQVMKAHTARSLPGEPFISHRITQHHCDGAVVCFDIAACVQGVKKSASVFASLVAKARETCFRHGGSLPSERSLDGIKETLDPCQIFGAPHAPEVALPEEETEEESEPGDKIRDAFDLAIKQIKSFGSSNPVSNSQKLELYSLFKHATQGPCPRDKRPSAFDPVARAKYDAWSKIDSQMSSEEAMEGYVKVVELITSTSIMDKTSEQSSKASRDAEQEMIATVEDETQDKSTSTHSCSGDIQDAFDLATEEIKKFWSSNPSALSNPKKLELYSLYKYATDGPCPGDQRPSAFDPVARAKYDAWSEVDAQLSREGAMRRYIQAVEVVTSISIMDKLSKPNMKQECPTQIRPAAPERAVSGISMPSITESLDSSEGSQEPDTVTHKMASDPARDATTTPNERKDSSGTSTEGSEGDSYPLLPPRWHVFVLLGCLAYIIFSRSLGWYASVFYVITWSASPFADWRIAFQLLRRSLSAPYGNLPPRFNLVGIGALGWVTFVRFPCETVLWYLDELFFTGYNDTEIKEPLFLLGQPRSGTTKFQDVLTQDEDTFCSMYLYEMRFPYLCVQYLVDFLSKMDRLYLDGQGYQFAIKAGLLDALPQVGERKAMRRLRFDLPDEDDALFLFHGLCHFALTGMFPSADTAKSLYQMSELPVETRRHMMEFHQKAVRKVLYRRGHGRRYLAKWVAGWNGLLDEAKTVYPDAKYVTIVRNPSDQLPSWMKLQGLLSEQIAGHNMMKMPEVRKAVIDINAQWYQSQVKFCKETPQERMLIVGFEDFVKDIPQQVCRLYAFLGHKVVPGSRFHQSLVTARNHQSQHKRTVVRAEEQFIAAKEISQDFLPLEKEIINPCTIVAEEERRQLNPSAA